VDDDGQLWMDKQTGAQQQSGLLSSDENPRRLIFTGKRKAAGKLRGPFLGSAARTEAAGIFERIGPMRYRLTFPRPQGKYKLELLELTPAPIQLDG
jgi:hypothetical protein